MVNLALTRVTPVDSYSGFSLKNLFGKKKKKRELSPVDLEIQRLETQQKQQLAQERQTASDFKVQRANTMASVGLTAAVAVAAGIGLWAYYRRKKRAK